MWIYSIDHLLVQMSQLPFCFTFRICQRVPVPSAAPYGRGARATAIQSRLCSRASPTRVIQLARYWGLTLISLGHDHRHGIVTVDVKAASVGGYRTLPSCN